MMTPKQFEAEVMEIYQILAESDVDIARLTALHIGAAAVLRGAMGILGSDPMMAVMIADACHRFAGSPPEYLRTLIEATRRRLKELGTTVIGPDEHEHEPSKMIH